MIQPDFQRFQELAREGNLVPVHDTYTADLLTPVGAHLRLARKAKYSFLLESVEGGETIGRYTFTGVDPEEVFRARLRSSTIETHGKTSRLGGDPVEHLRRLTSRYRPVRIPGLPPLTAGAIGYFGVDDCVMMFYLGLVAFDHVQHRISIIRNVFTEGRGSLRSKYDQAVQGIR